jgi:hypothetical protein
VELLLPDFPDDPDDPDDPDPVELEDPSEGDETPPESVVVPLMSEQMSI